MSPLPQPKIKLIIKRSNNGALNASSYPTPKSEKEPSPLPIASGTAKLKLPAKPTLQQAQDLLQRFGRDPTPLIHDAKKQAVIPGPARTTVLKSRRRDGKPVTCLGSYAIGRSISEKVALKRLEANREAARVEAAKQIANQPVALQDAFAIREQVLLKEYELCMAATVIADVAKSGESTTVAKKSTTPIDTPRRKTSKRKAAAVASPRTTRSSAKRRKN